METKIYSTQSCHYCVKVKNFLKQNNIDYTEIIVGQDITPEDFMEATGEMGVPVTIIGNEQIVGFNEEQLKTALNL